MRSRYLFINEQRPEDIEGFATAAFGRHNRF
jgi:hypothetical protein